MKLPSITRKKHKCLIMQYNSNDISYNFVSILLPNNIKSKKVQHYFFYHFKNIFSYMYFLHIDPT